MECHVCLEAFDAKDRRPKSLPCGHTYCLRCLQLLEQKRCPVDNQVFESAPADLADNFMVLQQSTKPAARLWCVTCQRAASKRCLDEHAVCSLKRVRAEEAAPLLEALRQDEERLTKLGEAFSAGLEQVRLEGADLAAKRRGLEEAMEADAAVWAQAKQAAARDGIAPSTVQLASDLADPTAKCSLTVRLGAAGDVAWRGEVRTASDAVATLLLSVVAGRGGLQQQQGEQRPAAPAWRERPNEVSGEEMAERMWKDSRVTRGRDWTPWRSDDGTPPGPGTVTYTYEGRRSVKWDSTGKSNTYDMGWNGRYQLHLLPPARLKPHLDKRHHQQCLDVGAVSANFQEMSTILTDGRLGQARALVGLPCLSAPTWSQKVLQQVAPHLEGLELVSPQQRHLDLAVAMPRLQTLEVHCIFEAPLPVVAYPKTALRWLRCGFYPLAAALALVRANAETLEELQLVAASKEPYGCPDLAAELSRCGLKKLRRMVLLRHTGFDQSCSHDKLSCEAQKAELWVAFVDSGLAPSLLCSECDPNLVGVVLT